MLDKFVASNLNDSNGNPAGGSVTGMGLGINWQDGPLGRDKERVEPNGAFVETVIQAAKQRIEYYQESKFKCDDNAEAVHHLAMALVALNRRTKNREDRKVEGTHTK